MTEKNNMTLDQVIEKLNTKFGEKEYSDFFKITIQRLRYDNGLYVLITNTLDNISSKIISSLDFKITEIADILDTRRIYFRMAKEENEICPIKDKFLGMIINLKDDQHKENKNLQNELGKHLIQCEDKTCIISRNARIKESIMDKNGKYIEVNN